METTQLNPIDKLLPIIATAVAEWSNENTLDHLKKTVKDRLEKAKQEITLKLLGFENSWNDGEWRIDNCNGRAANTAVGKFLAEAQSEAIKEWLTTVCMPKLTPALKKRLEAAAQQTYNSYMDDFVRRAARSQVEQDAKALVTSVVSSNQINDYIRAMKLINQE